ncbi:hypothetical protein OH76DRAFT_1399088 [Lentinus brumalis]|uniref:Uncharacterized protein n=1 Tax=Lentinus brumalis TaxID=2498619 RepID=A0A371DMZ7_9APHY|nr:hypothetical protein OH76DRAFT_1399088 [Polyporus brumalis]
MPRRSRDVQQYCTVPLTLRLVDGLLHSFLVALMAPRFTATGTPSSKKPATSARKRAASSQQHPRCNINSWSLFMKAFHVKIQRDLKEKGIEGRRVPQSLKVYIQQAWASAPAPTKPYFQQLAAVARKSAQAPPPAHITHQEEDVGRPDIEVQDDGTGIGSSSSGAVPDIREAEGEGEDGYEGEWENEEVDDQAGPRRPRLTITLPARRSFSKDAWASPLTELSEDLDGSLFTPVRNDTCAGQLSPGTTAEHGPLEVDAAATVLHEAAEEDHDTVMHANLPRLTLNVDAIQTVYAPWL